MELNANSYTESLMAKLALAKEYAKRDETEELESVLANDFDENYYGELKFNLGVEMELESIWTDRDGHINMHVDTVCFEGDILFKSVDKSIQLKVIEMLERVIPTMP